jgi:hypothetical protein
MVELIEKIDSNHLMVITNFSLLDDFNLAFPKSIGFWNVNLNKIILAEGYS